MGLKSTMYSKSWREEDDKADASSGPSWFRGHRWWRNSRRHSENSRNWSDDTDDEDEVSAPSEVSLARQALGLNTSGPLKLEDVKNAYRACALRWHPDRHNGSSKVSITSKFNFSALPAKSFVELVSMSNPPDIIWHILSYMNCYHGESNIQAIMVNTNVMGRQLGLMGQRAL
ncbi:hypothetical protein PR202_gb20750 [Eleusine coracana subsp. coracana]|uniref:J domain-containing protein n=1 Tax=Eleusine coracana subsp. coracana TaxID=191504 RepID=A0AAV5F9A7_ELECO|nr:hypothetical protein PR202_gb20750 [Eleusine coracana subsp. coracana]